MANPGPDLQLSTDKDGVQAAFREWHEILKAGSRQSGNRWEIIGTDVRFRRIDRHSPRIHTDFWIGSATSAAVQINETRVVSREDGGSHIGLDTRSHRYLLRQGDIHGNDELGRVKDQDFTDRTGIATASVRTGKNLARKQWHIVTRLDGVSAASIRAATADFVQRCWNARIYGAQASNDQQRLEKLLGRPERGGWHDVEPDPTPRRVLLIQGYVFEELEQILKRAKVGIEKPRHAAGYEVDGVVSAPGGDILVEIKTGVAAADVYCGIGQLTVYPILLPDLARLDRVLLLPGTPRSALADAIKTAGVELQSYGIQRRGRKRPDIRFSEAFLRRCGLSKKLVEKLRAEGRLA